MVVKAANRIGRRAPLSLRTTDELRSKLEASASESGRNLTLEVERRLELSYEWERAFGDREKMLADFKAKLTEMDEETFRADARRRGYTIVHGASSPTMAPPGALPPSGFIPDEPAAGLIEDVIDKIVRRAVAEALEQAGIGKPETRNAA